MKAKIVKITVIILVVGAALAVLSRWEVPETAAADGLNGADMAWVSVCAALVMLMTPALGFFYGGLVRQKNIVATIVQCLIIFALITGVWTFWGYSLAFGPSIGGVVGNLKYLLLRGVGSLPDKAYAATIPALLFYFFQLKFAAITPALIIGSVAERVKFSGLLAFLVIWATVVYAPVAHWVWGVGGWLRNLGVLDFAGGTVVHVVAGVTALAAVLVIGRRQTNGNDEASEGPSNVPYVILGASLLWFGWFGFNGGSALAMNGVAVNALITTNLAGAFAVLSWMSVDWYLKGKPSASGAAIGGVCGLAAVTPAVGYVDPAAAVVIGLLAGLICNLSCILLKRTKLDDTLDVFACHGVGGIWGTLATGIFAQKAINPAGANGLLYGNPKQFLIQLLAIVVIGAWAFVMSVVILKVMDALIGLRVSAEDEAMGLDLSQHGETAYNLNFEPQEFFWSEQKQRLH